MYCSSAAVRAGRGGWAACSAACGVTLELAADALGALSRWSAKAARPAAPATTARRINRLERCTKSPGGWDLPEGDGCAQTAWRSLRGAARAPNNVGDQHCCSLLSAVTLTECFPQPSLSRRNDTLSRTEKLFAPRASVVAVRLRGEVRGDQRAPCAPTIETTIEPGDATTLQPGRRPSAFSTSILLSSLSTFAPLLPMQRP